MKEIKFRGKRADNGEWVYGDLLQTNEGSVCIGVHGQYIDDGMHFNDMYNETPYIDEDTIGQFTGLADCKRNPIYEGDIFTVNGKYPKLVEYREDRAAFCIANVDELDKEWIDPWQQPAPDWWYRFSRGIVVVGNKFDNPELIPNKPTAI